MIVHYTSWIDIEKFTKDFVISQDIEQFQDKWKSSIQFSGFQKTNILIEVLHVAHCIVFYLILPLFNK